jgi:peptide/nickel transport system substrate-binding protein
MNKAALLARLAIFLLPMAFCAFGLSPATAQQTLIEPDYFKKDIAAGVLPPINERVPSAPFIVPLEKQGKQVGRYGGSLRILGGSAKDTRLMVVYGYARLVGYNEKLKIVADIAESVDVENGRIFTFHLRKGHRWSDGHPFTAEDFRYYWEDLASNKEASRMGLPQELLVDGQPPRFDVIDALTVRYSWPKPNPFFLPALAGARPIYIFRPAHYLKQFHPRYTDPDLLAKKAKELGQRNWVSLHFFHDRPYKNKHPERPSLQPWVLKTPPPSDRFIFVRNPYYHRIDSQGRQLPYIDTVAMTIASSKLIPAKAGSGEVDLQGRYLSMGNYTFLKQGEKRNDFTVLRWLSAKGSKIALFPNLNVNDAVWQQLFRQPNFRRALSMSINRHDINQVIYFGLALEGNNTVLPRSELSQPTYRTKWAQYDPQMANAMFDALGLDKRNEDGIRLLADGREMEIIVETAGEDSSQIDVLDLIRDDWRKVGIKLFIKPLQREVFRRRIFSGASMMSVWQGMENAIPTSDSSPEELAPTSQQHLQWPRWGQFFETQGRIGEAPNIPAAERLLELYKSWITSVDHKDKTAIWKEMLEIHADQAFTIGLVSGVSQLVVVNNRLRNVPEKGVYNWNPGAMFGVYRPDTFWYVQQ